MRSLIALGLLVLAVSSAEAQRAPAAAPFREVAVDRIHHFVVASPAAMRNRAAVMTFARKACGTKRICFVHFWVSPANAGTGIPMTDKQVEAMVASYNRNLNTGNDKLQCYNYGSAGERCA